MQKRTQENTREHKRKTRKNAKFQLKIVFKNRSKILSKRCLRGSLGQPGELPGASREPPGSGSKKELKKRREKNDFWRPPGSPKFMKKRVRKMRKKRYPPKKSFFAEISDFWAPRRRFALVLGPKIGPRRLVVRCVFENGDVC